MLTPFRRPTPQPGAAEQPQLSGPEQLFLNVIKRLGIDPAAVMQMMKDVFGHVKQIKEDISEIKSEQQQLRAELLSLRDSISHNGGRDNGGAGSSN